MRGYLMVLPFLSLSLAGCQAVSQTAASVRYPGAEPNSRFAGAQTLRLLEVDGTPLPGEATDEEMGEILAAIRSACGIVPLAPPESEAESDAESEAEEGEATAAAAPPPPPPPMIVNELASDWLQALLTRARSFFDQRAALLPLAQGPRAVPRCFAAFRFGVAPRAEASATPALLWAFAFQSATLPGGADTLALAIRPVLGRLTRSAAEVQKGRGLSLRLILALDVLRDGARAPLLREEFLFRATALGTSLAPPSADPAPQPLRPLAAAPAPATPPAPTLTVNPLLSRPFPPAPAGFALFSLAVLEAGDGAASFADLAGVVPGFRGAVTEWLTGAPRTGPAAGPR